MVQRLLCFLGCSYIAWAVNDCDESTLVQGASRLRLSRGALAASDKFGISMGNNGTELLESVKKMAEIVKEVHEGRMDDDALQVIGSAIESVANQIATALPVLGTEHGEAQSRIDIARDAAVACTSSDVYGTEHVNQLNADVVSRRTSHANCRATQVQLLQTQNTECDALSDFISQLRPASCEVPTHPDSVSEMFTGLQAYIDSYHTTFSTRHTACEEAQAANRGHTCTTMQAQFESAYCAARTDCAVLDECWSLEKAELDGIAASERTSMELRQSQFRILTQSRCILDQIRQAITSNSTIDNSAVGQCGEGISIDDFVLTFHDPPAPTGCTESASPAACSPAFLSAEYGELVDWQQVEARQACIACPGELERPGELEPCPVHDGMYLRNYAPGLDSHAQSNIEESLARCSGLGESCSGITCNAEISVSPSGVAALVPAGGLDPEVARREDIFCTARAPGPLRDRATGGYSANYHIFSFVMAECERS